MISSLRDYKSWWGFLHLLLGDAAQAQIKEGNTKFLYQLKNARCKRFSNHGKKISNEQTDK